MKSDDPRHGTVNGYVNLRCRCAPCTAAHTEYHRNRRNSTTKVVAAATTDTYNKGTTESGDPRGASTPGGRDRELRRSPR